MHSPWARVVQLEVSLPVLQRLARFSLTLAGQGEVVVRVGVSGRQLDGGSISGDCILNIAGFVEYVAQIEVGERIARVGSNSSAIMLLGGSEILAVVIQSSQVDMSCGVLRLDLQHAKIGADRLVMSRRMLFHGDAVAKELSDIFQISDGLDLVIGDDGIGGNQRADRSEVHDELAGDGLDRVAFMTIGDARSNGEGAGLNQRILHAGYLFLHGLKRFADHGRTHTFCAQVADLLKLKEVVEGKRLGNGSKSCTLPANQLLGRDVQDPKDVRSTI